MRHRTILVGGLAALLVVVMLIGLGSFTVVPRGAAAPDFTLTDAQGQPLSSDDLRGQVVLYTFGTTRCSAPCHQTNDSMQALQQRLEQAFTINQPPVTLVSISVDPAHDTPDVLRRYATSLRSDPKWWRFVTGDAAMLKQVVGGGFKTFYTQNADGTYTVDPVFVLVDDQGFVRGTYRTSTPNLNVLLRDIGAVVREVQESTGMRRYAYEAAHLFVCSSP